MLNSKRPYPSPEREIEFRRCLFMFSIKREIRQFQVIVVQKWYINVQKSVMHVRSCCFANRTYCFFFFFDVLVTVASLDRKVHSFTKHSVSYKYKPFVDFDCCILMFLKFEDFKTCKKQL